MSAKLHRWQRRQMQRLASAVGRATDDDRLFFERFPDRQHRVRMASAAEMKHDAIAKGRPFCSSNTSSCLMLIKNVAPGVQLRKAMVVPIDISARSERLGNATEKAAKSLFDAWSNDQCLEIEAGLKSFAEAFCK